MDSIAFALMLCFAFMAIYQVLIAVWFSGLLLRRPAKHSSNIRWPKTAVMMSLRGADPQLNLSLQRMLEQDYPNYKLHVVVDSLTDPAHAVVAQAADFYGDRIDISVLTQRRSTCGLQCSAFVQAYGRIDADAEVIVTVDGDLMPHPTWLQDLLAPLQNPRVGATFGNRWFTPTVSTYGGLVRYLWNAAAVVPMALLSIPWGGCLAMRRSAFDQATIADKWSKAIVHDAPIVECLKALKLKIRFVPNLMMPIREQCSWSFCLDFIKRQMTWTRIYHSGWGAILLHALLTTLLWLLAFGQVALGATRGNGYAVAMAGGSLLGYVIVMLALVSWIEYAVRVTLRRRQENTSWGDRFTWLKLPIALVLAQGTHFLAVLLANNIRQVTWRGVTYLLRGPWDVQLQTERPFEPNTSDASL